MRLHRQQIRVESFQEVLSSLNNNEALSAVFEDFKLEMSTDHPAKELRSYHGNQASKSTADFILIQRNDANETQENHVNGHDESSVTTRGSVSSSVTDSTLNDSVNGFKVDDLSQVLESDVQESHLKPLSIDQARSLLSIYTQILKKKLLETPLCIICDSNDPEHTCLLDASPVIENASLVGVLVTTISSAGPLHGKAELMKMEHIIKMTSPSMASQCATHGFAAYEILGKSSMVDVSMATGHGDQSCTTVKLDCRWEDVKNILEIPHGAKCTAVSLPPSLYEILGKSSMVDVSMAAGHGDQSCTTVKLDCSWEDVKNVLETPHGAKCTAALRPTDIQVLNRSEDGFKIHPWNTFPEFRTCCYPPPPLLSKMHIKAAPGSLASYARRVYSELCTLVGFAAGATSGAIQWPKTTKSSKTSVETLLEELIESVKQGEQKRVPVLEGNGSKSNLAGNNKDANETKLDSPLPQHIEEREDLDFTERLWMLLKDHACCYDDIVTTVKKVMEELQSGQLQPMVHTSNCSTLAKRIRSSYQHNLLVDSQDTEGLGPLGILIEIGVEKLKRDYLAFFISQELTTLEKLQWYVSPPDASTLALEELVRRLQCLHQVTELFNVGHYSIHLPRKTLWTLVRCGLTYYENAQSRHDDDHIFSVQVDCANMARFYSSLQPSLWRVEAKHGSTGADMKRTVYQVTSERPFQHVSYNNNEHENGLDQTVEGDHSIHYQTLASSSHITLFS